MTQRPEAGHRPPLRPTEQSSITAPFSRERDAFHLAPFRTTEVLRTGTEGLFAAVRGELARTHRTTEPHAPDDLEVVIIASGNSKKTDDILSQVSHHQLQVKRIPEAEEWHTKDAVLDATSKAMDAHHYIQERMEKGDVRREVRTQQYVMIANDQLNAVPTIVEHPVTHLSVVTFERLGKPNTDNPEYPIEVVRSTLQNMADLAEKYHWKSVPYIIELATVIYNPRDPDNNAVSLQRSAVFLSVDGLKHVATDRFDEYLTAVQEQAGSANGKAGASDIAGGLEFQVLDKMGVVEFVSGTPKDIETKGFPPQQREEAKDHAYAMALGTSDKKLIEEYFNTNP